MERVSWFDRLRNILSSKPFFTPPGNRRQGTRRPPWLLLVRNGLLTISSWNILTFWRKVETPKFVNTKSIDVAAETALHVAVRENRADVIRLLINRGADLRAGGLRGETPLHLAARRSSETVRTLLGCVDDAERRVLANEVDSFGNTALHDAACSLGTLRLLVDAGGNLTLANHNGRTPLMVAAEVGVMHVVEYVVGELATGGGVAHLDARDCRGVTALCLAAKGGFKKIVALLIRAGTEFIAADNDGQTPLHEAAAAGETAVVKTLLDAVNVPKRISYTNALTKYGHSALALAIYARRLKIIEVLVEAGADIALANSDGETALMAASEIGFCEAVDYILKTFDDDAVRAVYVNVSVKHRKDAALHRAIKNGHSDIIATLIANGADVAVRASWNDSTPLHSATKADRLDIVQMLIAASGDVAGYVNLTDDNGETALHVAVFEGSLRMAEVLIGAGAKMAMQNRDGTTALMLAVRRGVKDFVRVMLDEYRAEQEGVRKVDYLSARDRRGKSATDLARENNNLDAEIRIGDALNEEGFVDRGRWEGCVMS